MWSVVWGKITATKRVWRYNKERERRKTNCCLSCCIYSAVYIFCMMDMEYHNLKTLNTFDIHSLPNLDVVVLGALERFISEELPVLDVHTMCKNPLVVGSANAHAVGRILFRDTFARFAEEGDFEENLKKFFDRDCVVIISASGSKHAVSIAKTMSTTGQGQKLPTWLLTNNKKAPAQEFIPDDNIIVLPKNREPYTYNTSTYLSMILAQTKESPEEIYTHLEIIKKYIPKDLGRYSAFVLTVPSEFDEIRSMFRTKFDELFGGHVVGRVFTDEEVKHAKTVVPYEGELFIHFSIPPAGGIAPGGGELEVLTKSESKGAVAEASSRNAGGIAPARHRKPEIVSGVAGGPGGDELRLSQENGNHLYIPLTHNASYGEMLSVGYFVIGKIQEAHPAYFKDNIVEYTKDASEIFNQTINPIVE